MIENGSLRQRGFTVLEITIVVGLFSMLVGVLLAVLTGSENQVEENRVRIRAAIEHRRNLDAIANVLREVDVRTLQNFDAEWKSPNPTFSRVTGASDTDRTYGDTLELRWQPKPDPIDGVEGAGEVRLIGPSENRVIADRVPQDGFMVRQDGGTLVIQLSTYHATTDRRTFILSGQTAVTLRN